MCRLRNQQRLGLLYAQQHFPIMTMMVMVVLELVLLIQNCVRLVNLYNGSILRNVYTCSFNCFNAHYVTHVY